MLLEQCLQGSAPLPEADVESIARRAGLCWVQRRVNLLTRSLIARAPKVWVHLLHLTSALHAFMSNFNTTLGSLHCPV